MIEKSLACIIACLIFITGFLAWQTAYITWIIPEQINDIEEQINYNQQQLSNQIACQLGEVEYCESAKEMIESGIKG